MSDYSPEAMRRRFWAATREAEAIRARSKPLRDERDQILEQMRPLLNRERELIAAYRQIEQELPRLDEERAMLARALAGKTGQPV